MKKRIRFFSVCAILLFQVACASNSRENPAIDNSQIALTSQKITTEKNTAHNASQEKLVGPLRLPKLIELALQNNKAILASRYDWQKTIEKYPQVVSLPDPKVTYGFPVYKAMQRADMEMHKITFMQEIPFPTKLYWRGEIAKEEAHMARLAYEKTVRDTVAQVQIAFYEAVYFETAIKITKENQEILHSFIKSADVEVSKGKTPLSDLLRSQSQLAQMEYDLVRLEELRRVNIGQLNALLDLPPSQELTLEITTFPRARPIPDFQAMYDYAVQNRQEILATKVGLARADHDITLAKHEYLPDLSVGFEWARVERNKMLDPPEGGNDGWMLMFGVNLPIWFPKNNARIREARFSAQSIIATKKDMENQLAASLKKTYYKAANAYRLVQLYLETLLPQSRQAIAIGYRWYRSGEGSLLGVLDAQSILLNFSLAHARAEADYAESLVEIAQLCGGTLPVNLFTENDASVRPK